MGYRSTLITQQHFPGKPLLDWFREEWGGVMHIGEDSIIVSSQKETKLLVQGYEINLLKDTDFISLTDMLKAKDGEFFIADWLRNRNTVEFLGIWETLHNPDFNYGGFATIKSQVGLNSYKLSVKEWIEKTNAIGLRIGILVFINFLAI